MKCLYVLGLSVVAAANPGSLPAAELIDDIEAAWNERQERIRTFDVEWEESLTMMKNSARLFDGEPFPPDDVTHVRKYRMVGKEEKLFYSRQGLFLDRDVGGFAELDFRIAFDGDETRELWLAEKLAEHPSGYITPVPNLPSEGDYHIQGVIAAFRPLVAAFSGLGSLLEWSGTDRTGTIADVPCLILERMRGPLRETLWLAEDGDYRVLRHEMSTPDRTFSQLTIDYDAREDVGNVFRSCRHTLLSPYDGNLRHVFTATVQRLDINEPVADEQFRITFPVGTVVQEYENVSVVTEESSSATRSD